jgi:hypothetical protein
MSGLLCPVRVHGLRNLPNAGDGFVHEVTRHDRVLRCGEDPAGVAPTCYTDGGRGHGH